MGRFPPKLLFTLAVFILAAPLTTIEAKDGGASQDCASLKSLHINKQSNPRAAWLNATCNGRFGQATLETATPRPQGIDASKAFGDSNLNQAGNTVLVNNNNDGATAEAESAMFNASSAFGGSNLNLVNPEEIFPAVTQAGSTVWGNNNDGATPEAESVVVSVFNDTSGAPDSFSGISVSTNGGISFEPLNTVDAPNPFDSQFTTDIGSPSVAYDENAGLWLALTLTSDCDGQGIGLMSTATPADSASWVAEACPHMGVADDRPVLWVDNNNASAFYGRRYIAYNDFDADGALRVLWSDDETLTTWNDVTVAAGSVDPDTMALSFIRNVNIAGEIDGSDGRLHLFAMDEAGGAGASRLNWVYNSSDGGVTWAGVQPGPSYPPVGAGLCSGSDYFYMVPPNWRHMGWGQGAVGPGGVLHYVYARKSQTPDDIGDIYYIRSVNNGANWSAPMFLNTDQNNKNNVVQWLPSVSVTNQGLVLVAWYDRRNTTDGLNFQYYGRLSLDNGASWQPDKPISDTLIEQPTQFDPMKEFCFAGDSNLHNALDNDALVTWTDGRNTKPDAELVEQSQMDVYFSRVPLCPAIGVAADNLPNGELTVAYSQTLSGTGGTGPYTFALSGLLPDGLGFQELSGDIFGTPTSTGISFFSVIATDSFGCQGSEDYGVIIDPAPAASCPAITLDPAILSNGAQGEPEMQLVTALGGTGPYTYTISEGVLPMGVSLDLDSGELTGTPEESSSFSFDITATDANQCTGTQAYTTLIACPMITLSPPTQLPDAAAGFLYLTNVTANGGTAPYKFFPQSATPKGVFYAEGGTIFGVVEKGGTKNTTIAVTDVNGCFGEQSFRLDSKNCPPGALFCDNSIDPTGEDFSSTDVCGGSETQWYKTQSCPSSDDMGHTPSAHARWGIPRVLAEDGITVISDEDCNSYGTTPSQNVLESREFDASNCNSGEVRLTFDYLISYQDDSTQDRARVETSSDGGALEVIADNGPGTAVCGGLNSPGLSNLKLWSGWQNFQGVYPASSSFQVNFVAETQDGMNNAGEGFFVDDFVLQCECPVDFVMMPDVLPNAAVDTAYAESITTEGGQPLVKFGGPPGDNPPSGLTLDPDSGVLFGVPTTPGVFEFTVEATDDNACQISKIYDLIVSPAGCPTIAFDPLTLENGIEETFYAESPTASGGTEPYTYTVSTGDLPPGLSLNTETGSVSGTPTTAGVYPFTVSALDFNFCDSSQDFNINIGAIGCPDITFSPTELPNADTRFLYDETVAATGGAAPYTYSLSAGLLPPGMTMDPETGEIFGFPASGGEFSFETTALDINGCFGVQSYILDVFGCEAITLSPNALPTGVNTLPYDQLISTVGGVAPYTYVVTAGMLPDGLILDPMSGAITGIPTLPGSFPVDITVADSNGCTGIQSYNMLINPAPCPTITLDPPSLINAVLTEVYSDTVTASGGQAPYSYNISMGVLPNGLILDANSGTIGGTPTVAGIFNFDITTNDANGCLGFKNYFMVASPVDCPAIMLSPLSLSDADAGVAYSQIVTADGGVGPYNYFVSAGTLPAGLSLDAATGEITGTSISGGIFDFDITATDANICAGVMSYSINVLGCPTITLSPDTLPNGVATAGYSQTVVAAGGIGAYTYSVSAGALPGGLMLNSDTGEISGTAAASGVFGFDVTALDINGCAGVSSYTLIIDATPCSAVTIAPAEITNKAILGVAYSQPLVSSGGIGPYSWSVSAGALPNGLLLNALTGEISGTATVAGIFNFDITSEDINGCSGVRGYTLIASASGCPTITLSPATLAGGTATIFYSGTVTASGGVGPYTYTVTTGALPAGLSLNASTGEISGIPLIGGVSSFQIVAEDSNGCFGVQDHSLTITAAGLEIIFKDGFEGF